MIFTSDNYQWNITIYKDGDSTSTTTTVPVDDSYIVTVHDVVDGVISNEPAINYGHVYVCVPHTSTVVMFTTHIPSSSSSSEVPSGESV